MKIIYLLLFILFIGGCNLSANKYDKNISIELTKIKMCNSQIDSLLNIVINDNLDYLEECKDCFLQIGLIKNKGVNHINMIIYSKEKFTITCPENTYPIIGYSEFGNHTILLVGDILPENMEFSDEKKKFIFKCYKEKEGEAIPPPPSMYNPPNYMFKYE